MSQAAVNETPGSVVASAVQQAAEAAATQQPVFTPAIEPATAPSIAVPLYEPTAISGGDPEAFYQPASAKILSAQILDATIREGPISEEVLFRKLARAWGLERTGARITKRLRELAPPEMKVTNAGGVRFYWPPTVNPDEWTGFRGSDGSEPSRRHVEEVAVQEIANLAAFLLDQGGSTSTDDLAKSICRTIGMARTPADAQNRALLGITHLVQSGRAIMESERVRLPR
jgi:hypothetical protein